jgi:hypothetical protein
MKLGFFIASCGLLCRNLHKSLEMKSAKDRIAVLSVVGKPLFVGWFLWQAAGTRSESQS